MAMSAEARRVAAALLTKAEYERPVATVMIGPWPAGDDAGAAESLTVTPSVLAAATTGATSLSFREVLALEAAADLDGVERTPMSGTLGVSGPEPSVAEGTGADTRIDIQVYRLGGSGAVSAEYVVNPRSLGVSANDFVGGTFPTGTVSWADGDFAAKTVTFYIAGDSRPEPHESFRFSLRNPTNATISLEASGVNGTVVNDDFETQTIVFDGDVAQAEGNSGETLFTFTVSRSGGVTGTINFRADFSPQDTDTADFVGGLPFNSPFLIPDGQASRTFSYSVQGDSTPETTERFGLSFGYAFADPSGAGVTVQIGTSSTAQGVIQPDDAAILGTTGPDLVVGTSGRDWLRGLDGDDTLAAQSDDDALDGEGGADIMIGGAGADRMDGGADGDQYLVDNGGDRIIEAAGGGYDIVFSLVDYTLTAGAQAEELSVTDHAATTAINLTGNEFANGLYGNAGANRLAGRGGLDVLAGYGGADIFVFDLAPAGAGVDRILDFEAGLDKIGLGGSAFGLAGVNAANFVTSQTGAQDANDRIIHDAVAGALFYDADGTGAGAAVLFAVVTPGLPLNAADFVVI